MSFPARSIPPRLPGPASSSSGGPSPALIARIEEKKAELQSLKQLRDMSAEVASQMEALEQQLSTLSNGTEAIATVIGNWHNVLGAINMASAKLAKSNLDTATPATDGQDPNAPPLPLALVRIPTEHAPSLQAQAELAEQEADKRSP
ncbi:DASH complex subunit Dad2-domain-containing protein [Plectosphaerella plurivora]|uniref:DASH complex subunit DAD2 n=1 Tax=Plectosphaerella plurivora TaxID=936078 RepID=A0A9P8V6B2_9PEZI|nr:DASH complex subunit Dad2-domain-containing protein [Plectosphaerella plurivora]